MTSKFAVASAVLCLALIPACRQEGSGDARVTDPEGKVRVGVFASLTGATAEYGTSSVNGIRMATEEANAAGGAGGRQVELAVEDDRSDVGEAVKAAGKLITQDRVRALLGESVSTRALAAAPVAQQNRVPMLTPASVKPEVTEAGDFIFRACFTSPMEGAAVAQFAAGRLRAKRAALVFDAKNDYAATLARFFRESFVRRGGEVVAEQTYAAGDADLGAQMAAVKLARADVVFAPGFYTTAGLVAREAKRHGVAAALVGSDGWDSPKLLEGDAAAFAGVYFANHFWADDPDPSVRDFVGGYRSRYGVAPDALAATAYDAARVLYDAIRRAGSTDPAAIREALARTSGFRGVTGVITINAERNATTPVYILRIEEGGGLSLQERIEADGPAPAR